MRVGRKISREIALNMAPMAGKTKQPLIADSIKSRGSIEQMIDPDPGQTSKTHFEATGPMDANGVGIFNLPIAPLAQGFVQKPRIARQSVRLGQGDQMLVPA